MGFFTALTLLFIVLKITGFITLSWWWVLLPASIWTVMYFIVVYIALKFPLWFINRLK